MPSFCGRRGRSACIPSWTWISSCVAGHRGARFDDRELRGARAIRRRAARLDLCAGASSRTASSCRVRPSPNEEAPVRLDAPWLGEAAARASFSRCSTATARRRGWSAAQCATRCSRDAAGRYRHRHHGAARRGDATRRGGGLQGGADRHRAWHRHRHCRRTSVRDHDAAPGCRDLRPHAPGGVRPRLEARRRAPRLHHQRAVGFARRHRPRLRRRARGLAARRVRFIGDAAKRIAEDYLRILRFFRFHAAYGEGAPDPEGVAACHRGRAPASSCCRASACAWS